MRLRLTCLVTGLISTFAFGQTLPAPDTSANKTLQGVYNFRQVIYVSFGSNGGAGQKIALSGNINFDGAGNYNITGQILDSSTTGTQNLSISGTYGVGANGLAYMDHPFYNNETIYGLVSRGVFLGSSTEGNINDIFVAIAAGSPAASTSTLSGTYWIGAMDYPSSDPGAVLDSLFQITADGKGGIAGTTVSGYIGGSSTGIAQSVAAFSYTLANGAGTLAFPAASGTQTLISGTKTLYVSADGNYVLGGSASGWDILFGVKAASGTSNNSLYNGSYFTAGIDEDSTDVTNAYFDAYYGSLRADGNGGILRHDRVAPFDSTPYDFTYNGSYTIAANGSYDRPSFKYSIGASGLGAVGIGKGPYLGLFMAVKAPDFSGTGVYINPAGVVNAASSAPFTAGVARGELVTIYGSGLSSTTQVASTLPFPNTLANVQVTVNGRPAPVYAVSPTQVSAIIPYATELSYATFQVINNGTSSNSVTEYVNATSPGVFTVPPGGVGYGAILHADYTLVSPASKAKKGETLLVFLTGLGDVSPAVTEGAAAPSNPLSSATNSVDVYIDGELATTSYVGLAPGLAGLYQINVVVPSTSSSGDVYLEIDGPDAATSQVLIPVQ